MPHRIACILLCCFVLLLAACGQVVETPVPTSPPTAAVLPTSAATGSYQPIDEAECTALQQDLVTVLGVEVYQEIAPFEDYVVGGRGTCCLLQAVGTGVDFPSEIAVTTNLQFLFEDQDWIIDIVYTAGGPTGTAFGLRKDNRLALVSVMWAPSADANCPTDRPISQCQLKPEQKLFKIAVQVAKK